jgi:multicomponent Na+:H+ antiporter subunit D
MLPEIPPAFLFLLGAVLLPLCPKKFRPTLFLLFPLASIVWILALGEGRHLTHSAAGMELILFEINPLNRGFGLAFSLAALAGGIYALHMQDLRQQVAALAYVGGSLGVTFAGDFFTLLIFWEVMAVSSTFLVWGGGTREAQAAGFRYLMVHLFGGGLLLVGVVLLYREAGTLELGAFAVGSQSTAAWIILLGVLVNAAAPPLHAWLPDSYTKATATGAIFLNAFTTKVAVYVIAQCFPGWPLILWVGVAMALYGVYYAVLANDMRLILSYHIISQVGYMLVGIGMGGELGVNAGVAHAYNNIIYKTLLFMGTGAVLYAVGRTKLTDLGGLGRQMKWVVALYLIGAFSISGFPLFSGFASKAMILHEIGTVEGYLLLVAAVGTFLSVGLKLTYYTWFYRESGLVVRKIPGNMYVAMGLLAIPCLLFGVWPHALFLTLPFAVEFQPYSVYMVVEAIQLPLFTFLGFWLFRKKILGEAKIALDTDWFYRRPSSWVQSVSVGGVNAAFAGMEGQLLRVVEATIALARNPLAPWRRPWRDYDPDKDRSGLGLPMTLTLLAIVVTAALVIF